MTMDEDVNGFAAEYVLGTLDAADLAKAVALQDKNMVARAPGVGPKVAARVVAELKDKMPAFVPTSEAPLAEAGGTPKEDLLSALVHLGYSRPEAERGVDLALEEDGGGRFEDLLRRTLRILSGR